jgi:hypothetical protein
MGVEVGVDVKNRMVWLGKRFPVSKQLVTSITGDAGYSTITF